MEKVLTDFVKALRNSNVRVSPAETLDAMSVIDEVGYDDRDLLKRSLSIVLPKTPDEKQKFDTCFDYFFSDEIKEQVEILSKTEEDIVDRLNKVLLQIVDHEENARVKLIESKTKMVYNHIGRAYGILGNAHSISSKETMNLLSLLRLGMDMKMFPGTSQALINELIIITQPAHLQKANEGKLSAEKRDILRSDLLRSRLQNVDRPIILHKKNLNDEENSN